MALAMASVRPSNWKVCLQLGHCWFLEMSFLLKLSVMGFLKWKKPQQLSRVGIECRRCLKVGEASAACFLWLLFGMVADLTSSLSSEAVVWFRVWSIS